MKDCDTRISARLLNVLVMAVYLLIAILALGLGFYFYYFTGLAVGTTIGIVMFVIAVITFLIGEISYLLVMRKLKNCSELHEQN